MAFIKPAGPADLNIHWYSNGRRLDLPSNEYRHTFSHEAVLVSSWLREEPLIKDTHYQCVAVSRSGNDTSKIDLRLSSRDEANTVSKELNQWRDALADHERQLQNWKKAWLGDNNGTVYSGELRRAGCSLSGSAGSSPVSTLPPSHSATVSLSEFPALHKARVRPTLTNLRSILTRLWL